MRGFAFGFRDYAVHLFPGCLIVSALLYLFFDFEWVSTGIAPLLVLLYLFGGYLAGFFIDAVCAVFVPKKVIFWLGGGDPLAHWFEGISLEAEAASLKELAAQIFVRDYGLAFYNAMTNKELLYLMVRDIEAANERSGATISRINALENMAKNVGMSSFAVTVILACNAIMNVDQRPASILVAGIFSFVGMLLLQRRNKYRSWLAKTVLRAFVSLDRQARLAASLEAAS